MTPATAADHAEIVAFLYAHVATSMFPLSNLRRHGMAGGHPRAMRFWLRREDGRITDLIGRAEGGEVFPQCPTGPWTVVAAALEGLSVKGILGDAAQVAGLRAALGVPERVHGVDNVEPQYDLSLADLIMPDVTGFSLRPLADLPLALAVDWRAAYRAEVMPMPGVDMRAEAERDIAGYLEADSHRVLYDGDQPVAMTGFNATLPEAVQIGGVYTPPDARGRGLARRAVALHLAEVRAQGVSRAILFAANAAAARAYEAIGFRRSGSFAILMLSEPLVVRG